jgi:hypothetical protein
MEEESARERGSKPSQNLTKSEILGVKKYDIEEYQEFEAEENRPRPEQLSDIKESL